MTEFEQIPTEARGYAMGQEAKRQGLICSPSTDPALTPFLTPIFSENVALMKAWIHGWQYEHGQMAADLYYGVGRKGANNG